MVNILVVDDDDNIRKLISTFLENKGYNVAIASNGEDALNLMENIHIDLLLADIMMPKMDGYELVESIRTIDRNMPILLITAKEAIDDKRKGFLAGTDDYIVKPIELDEMHLRIQALLRRAKISNERRIVLGEVELNYDSFTLRNGGQIYELPRKEFYLLYKLLSYPQKIFTRRQLMDEIWGMDSEADERTVDVHIKRLREKFDNIEEFKIVTVRGLGYKAERFL